MSRFMWTAVLLLACGCIDVDGEQGYYGSPCATFSSLLRCDRETGGADPLTVPAQGEPVVVSCETVCEQLADCGLFEPAEIPECAGECGALAWPIDCIYVAGCDLDAAEACFGGGEP